MPRLIKSTIDGFTELVSDAYAEAKDLLGEAATRASSRKFIAFLFATHMTYLNILGPSDWTMIAMLYMGVQGVLDWRQNESPQTPGTSRDEEEAGEVPRLPPPQ